MSMIIDREHDHLHCIYFYYLQYIQEEQDQEPVPNLCVYYHFDEDTPIRDRQDLMRLVRKLGENARAGDFAPPPCGHSFSAVPWRRKCYVVILLDDQVHKFPDPGAFNIDFKDRVEEDNHSFFNARKLDIDLSGNGSGDMVTAVCCVNLMQHKDGRDMEDYDDPEKYRVDLRPDGPVMLRFRDDDGGTNQGGPIPPPSFL